MASDDLKALLASFDDDEAEEEFQDEFFNEEHDQNLTNATEWSFVTANDTFNEKTMDNCNILDPDENVFNWSDDDFDKTSEDPKPILRTPENVKAQLLAERSVKKESSLTPKGAIDNVNVFLGNLNSKTKHIKNAMVKKEQYSVFDVAFGIRVKDPKLTPAVLSTYCSGFKKFKLSHLKPSNKPTGDWLTMGVIVSKGEFKKSAKNHEYMIWKLSDLSTFQDTPASVLLFGDCVNEHWKKPEGTVVALTSPQFADSSDNKTITLKLSKAAQIVEIGTCPDYGRCRGIKLNGEKCTQYVNVSSTEYCIYHITKAASNLSAKRGALGSEYNSPIGKRVVKKTNGFDDEKTGPHIFLRAGPTKQELLELDVKSNQNVKKLSREEVKSLKEAENLKLQALTEKKLNFGAKTMTLAKNKDDLVSLLAIQPKKELRPPVDVKNFLKEQKIKLNLLEASKLSRPTQILSKSPMKKLIIEPTNSQRAKAEMNRFRLCEQIKKQGGLEKEDPNSLRKSKKRGPDLMTNSEKENDENEAKRTKLASDGTKIDIKALLAKKSRHENVIEEVDRGKEQHYFKTMEIREKIETKLTETTEIKDVRVVTCKKCNYTNEKQSSFCLINEHPVQWHKATKRFFRCQACKQRITIFEMIPVKPCEKCGCNSFDRVGIKDERQVKQDKLLIRGEERKFVNL